MNEIKLYMKYIYGAGVDKLKFDFHSIEIIIGPLLSKFLKLC